MPSRHIECSSSRVNIGLTLWTFISDEDCNLSFSHFLSHAEGGDSLSQVYKTPAHQAAYSYEEP